MNNARLIEQLDSFDLEERSQALKALIARDGAMLPAPLERVNMHLHSFFSYNTKNYSPSHIAWEARQQGLYAAGLCDFDVLDGLEEFLAAGQALGLRATVNLETRAFLRDYAQVDINSPGEPGVTYIMASGFGSLPEEGSPEWKTLEKFRLQANERNKALVHRINQRLPEIAINYDFDVIPHSPGKCPTERHIIPAYRRRAGEVFGMEDALPAFWARLMHKPEQEVEALLADEPKMDEKVRSLLAKSGGIGYVRPDEKTFPAADDFIAWALQCGAIPMAAWLDGTSKGEGDMLKMLECLKAKGAAALNIIPDRNHNIKNADERRIKLGKLNEVIMAVRKLAFPVNIGTEMNKAGQPFADDPGNEELAPYAPDFLRGANIMVGQTLLARYAGFSYCGKPAFAEFGENISAKNSFFESVGKLEPLRPDAAARLKDMGTSKALQVIRDSAARGNWIL